jgi:hypothetical protein
MVRSSNPSRRKEFSLLYKFETVSGPHQTHFSWVPRFFRLGENKAAEGGGGGGIGHHHFSTAEIKNEWSYISCPPVCLQVEGRGKFTVKYFLMFPKQSTTVSIKSIRLLFP